MSDEKTPHPSEWPIPPADLPGLKRYVQGLYGMGVDGTAQMLRLIRTVEDGFTEAEVREAMRLAVGSRFPNEEDFYAGIIAGIRKERGG